MVQSGLRRGFPRSAVDAVVKEFQFLYCVPHLLTMNFLSVVHNVIEKTPSCCCLYLPNRTLMRFCVDDLFTNVPTDLTSVLAIVCSEQQTRSPAIPLTVTFRNETFSLVLVAIDNLTSMAFCYSLEFVGWWKIVSPGFHCSQQPPTVVKEFHRNWNLVIYFSSFGNQNHDQCLAFFRGRGSC